MCASLEASMLRPIKHMMETGMHMAGVSLHGPAAGRITISKSNGNTIENTLKMYLHKIIYFSFGMTFQTYL